MFNIENPPIRVDDQARLGPISMMLVYPPMSIAEREGLAEFIDEVLSAVKQPIGGGQSSPSRDLEMAVEATKKLVEEQARTIRDLRSQIERLSAPKPTWKQRFMAILNTDIRDIIRWLLR